MQLDLTTFHAVDLSTIAGGLKTGANFSCQYFIQAEALYVVTRSFFVYIYQQ